MVRIHTHWSNKVRPRLHNEYLSIPSPTKWDHFSLSFLSSVRFFVTRARRDPSTSSRPPRSDARVVSEIRGQIFVFLLFPSFSFDRLRSSEGTPRRRGHPPSTFFKYFHRTRTIFPLSRARAVYSIGDEGSTRAPRLVISHGGNADSLPGISRATRTRVRDDESTRNADARRGRLVYVYPRIRSSSDRASRARSEIIERSIDRRSTRALERERFDANRTTRARVRRVSTWRTRKI